MDFKNKEESIKEFIRLLNEDIGKKDKNAETVRLDNLKQQHETSTVKESDRKIDIDAQEQIVSRADVTRQGTTDQWQQDNFILKDINSIDSGLKKFHNDEIRLENLKKQHREDIRKQKEKIEAEYTSALESLAASDSTIESDYQKQKKASNQANSINKSAAANDINAIRIRYDKIIKRDNEYIEDLSKKCRIAANNDDKILQKYGMIPSRHSVKPNLDKIFSLFEKIMTDTADSFIKRTFKKDGFYAQKDMVRDFIISAANAIAYLRYEINEVIPRDCEAELQIAMNAATQTRSDLLDANEQKRKDVESKYQRDLANVKQLEQKYSDEENTEALNVQKNEDIFFESDLVAGFTSRVTQALQDSGAFDIDWNQYAVDRPTGTYFAWGNMHVPIYTECRPLQERLKNKIPAYARGSYFAVPRLLQTEQSFKMYMHYDASTKNAAYGNIQTFILQKMRSNPANHLQIFFADPNDRGQNLGVLLATNPENEAIGIYTQNTKDGIRDTLKEIVTYIDELNGELGDSPNLFDSNKKSDKKHKETVLVLCDVQNCIDMDTLPLLKVIWENATRCGISVFLTSQTHMERLDEHYPNMKTDWSFLNSKDLHTLYYTANKKAICGSGCNYEYGASEVGKHHRNFVKMFRENYANSLKINNLFPSLRKQLTVEALTEDQKRYGKACDGIQLPIMIDKSTNTVCRDFVIGTDNSMHTLITGGTGSGKSRFLQMIVSSIIMNYHPDDVELWLIDCKKVEFRKFMNNRPEHVRLVSLERTRDFTFAFLDYLKEFADNRTNLFTRYGVTKLKEYRELMNDPYCMPRVVIIIDEFHAITANVNTDPMYRDMLENALAEYRSIGISFIFSDQSVSGLKGLTEKGRQQLHNRVAMKNSIPEMKETLSLLSDNYLPGTLLQMEKSEGIGDFWWNCNPNVCYKNVFIDNAVEENLIAEVINRGEKAKTDTKVILVDGNVRTRFDKNVIRTKLQSTIVAPGRVNSLQFYMGAPTSLDEMFHFEMMQKLNNNVLITGRDTEMSADVIVTMLQNVSMQNDTRIILFADINDPCYNLILQKGLLADLSNVEIYDDYSDICPIIAQLHTTVKSRRPMEQKVFLVWLGMPDMYDEFCISPAKPENLSAVKKEDQVKAQGGFVVDNVDAALNDPELLEKAEALGLSVSELLGFLSGAEDEQVEETADDNDDELIYNAVQDMYDLFAMGAKFGLFNVVCMEFANDMRRVKGFNTDNFIHKIAFRMSHDESVEWGYRTTASELIEGLTALYTSGIEQCIFRPFLQ